MKVAILSPITHPLPPLKYAPWEKVVHFLAQGLLDHGIDVTVFAASDSRGEYKIANTVKQSLKKLGKFPKQQEQMHITEAAKKISRGNFDIVHNHLNWNGLLGLESIQCNYVTTVHGYEPWADYIFNCYKKRPYISISHAERKKSPNLNYVANIYDGIDFDYFRPSARKEDYLFVAGRICYDKGIHNAIKLARETNTKLYIAGISEDKKYFNKEVKPFIDNKLIFFLGDISQKDMHKYASRAKAYVSLLEWREPFGLSVAEAIACGTPIIATKKGSMTELVKDGVSGILVNDTAEAVQRIEETTKIKPEACRAYGEKLFSLKKTVAEHIKTYQKIIK